MNVYDSERLLESMQSAGFEETKSVDLADLILLNTCHIREKAAEKVYSELGRFKKLKEQNPELKIGVLGCVAQAEGEEIIKRQPLVDMVIGPQSYHRLKKHERSLSKGEKVIDIDFPNEDKFKKLAKRNKVARSPSAFLTVQEGCDKFCSFCVVPYTRGSEFSRPLVQLLAEAKELVKRGVREITLLGQNVNAYHGLGEDGKDKSLAKLIWDLSKVAGLERIRFTTSHPREMTDDLIEAHGECKKLMPYIHLPVQTGSDRILKKMNRGHDAKSYIRVIEKLRKARPDILISGDFIVGFPEETDEDFQATMELVKEVEYGQAFSFKYSPRPGTPAAERSQVSEEIKNTRLYSLQNILEKQQKKLQDEMVGREVKVLFEKRGKFENQMVGKTEYMHAVSVEEKGVPIGSIRDVKITHSNRNSLGGTLCYEK